MLILVALLVLALPLAGGCVHPCLALAEELCECEETESEREACKRQARSTYDAAPSEETRAAKERCVELLDECDCAFFATEEGKKACGVALP